MYHAQIATSAPKTAIKSPGMLKVAAVSCRVPVSKKVAKVPPINAPTIPKIIVESMPPP